MFKLEVDLHSLPADVVGELCRALFWPKEYGCYSNFDYGEDVIVYPSEIELMETDPNGYGPMMDITWNRAKWKGIITCMWFWEGDGHLEFIFPDGSAVVNSDCKKDHGWEWNHDDLNYDKILKEV